MMKYAQWFNIATIAIEDQQRRGSCFEPGLARKAALAAVGKPDGEGIDALADAIDAGVLVNWRDATKSVPAPGSDPNTLCSQFPSVLTLAEFD